MTETEEKTGTGTGNGTKLTLCFMRLNARITQKYCEILFWFFCVKWQGVKIKVNTKTD